MPTLNIAVAAGADDASETISSGAVTIDGTVINIRNTQLAGFRFVVPDIASGDTINSATLTLTSNSGQAYDFTVRGQAADNAAAFTTGTNDISARSLTTASVAASGTPSGAGAPFTTPDIASVIQEIVDRAGWAAGNGLALILPSTLAANSNVRTYDNSPSVAAVLDIDYTAGAAPSGNRRRRFFMGAAG